MLITIIFAVLALLIWIWVWLNINNSNVKDELNITKLQLKNLIDTYNTDTTDLHNKLQNAIWEKHKIRQDLVKFKWELIDAKKTITTLKEALRKANEPVPTPVIVNNTDNNKHTEYKKRGRPRKN